MTEPVRDAPYLTQALDQLQRERTERPLPGLAAIALILVAVLTLCVFLAGRVWMRLPAEAQVLRLPGALATLGALAVLALLVLARPDVLRRPAWIFWPALLVAIASNIAGFNAADPTPGGSSFAPRNDASLSALGYQRGWYNHFKVLRLYTLLHDRMRKSTIIAYPLDKPLYLDFPMLFLPHYLRYVAQITDYRTEAYNPQLSSAQVQELLSLEHVQIADPYYTKLDWVILNEDGPCPDVYRVLVGDGLHFLVRESRAARMLAR